MPSARNWRLIAVLMPITLPRASSSGPPELPKLIAASVWMKLTTAAIRRAQGNATLLARDDSDGHGLVELERVTDGDDPFADPQAVGIAEGQRRKFLVRPDRS